MTTAARAPQVSVIVPSYRGAKRLPRLLEAFSRQVTGRDWELVVVLDGDVDGSGEALYERRALAPLKVVALPQNRGRPAALNEGFAQSRGGVLIRCDDDLLPGPDFIERHASWHDGAANRGVIGLTRNIFGESRLGAVYGARADRLLREQAYAADPEQVWLHWAANSSVRRSMWERVGAYDDSFASCGEDGEWGYRLVRAGGRIVIDRALEVDHLDPAPDVATRLRRAFESGAAKRRRELLHELEQKPVGSNRPKARMWNAVVSLGSRRSSAEAYERIGRAIDVVLPVAPEPVARRMVAWGVESAGAAGERNEDGS